MPRNIWTRKVPYFCTLKLSCAPAPDYKQSPYYPDRHIDSIFGKPLFKLAFRLAKAMIIVQAFFDKGRKKIIVSIT